MTIVLLCHQKIAGLQPGDTALPTCGWVRGILNGLLNYTDEKVAVLYPDDGSHREQISPRLSAVSFPVSRTGQNMDSVFGPILKAIEDPVIVEFGTESKYKNQVIRCLGRLGYAERSAVWIQGLPGPVYQCYNGGLSDWDLRKTIKEWILNNGPLVSRKGLKEAAEMEKDTLQLCPNVIGRTTWDRAWIQSVNPGCRYFHCSETMRDSFYEYEWSYDGCEKHTVFVSQSNEPWKGFHHVLYALKNLIREFPDAQLSVTGRDILHMKGKEALRFTAYEKYLKKQIHSLQLENHVHFLGELCEEDMCRQYLKANVSVLASSVENSPNSLSEAMLLGVPIVASDVGGVTDLCTHRVDGYVFPYGDTALLTFYIREYFLHPDVASRCSANARNHANQIFNRENNSHTLVEICRQLNHSESRTM